MGWEGAGRRGSTSQETSPGATRTHTFREKRGCSMLRILPTLRRSSSLAVGALLLLLATKAWGAEPLGDEGYEVPEVVVGATRLRDVGIDLRRFPGNVTVVTAEDIKAKGARTVPEALLDVPGLTTFYDNAGNVYQQTIDLRGFNADPMGVAVFVDGARVNEPGLNQANRELIPLNDIES